jgi:hypothetical protein
MGKTFGEMTAEERQQAMRRVCARLQEELDRNAAAIGRAMDEIQNGDTE